MGKDKKAKLKMIKNDLFEEKKKSDKETIERL